MTWVSAADLARLAGVSRAAITKAIATERIPPAAVRRTGTRVMVEQSAGLNGIGHRGPTATETRSKRPAPAPTTAPAGGLFAWGTTAAPAPDPEPSPSPEPPGGPGELEQLRARERQWLDSYAVFRDWVLGMSPNHFTRELWDELGDGPHDIGTVLVAARDVLTRNLKPLDTLERRSRFG